MINKTKQGLFCNVFFVVLVFFLILWSFSSCSMLQKDENAAVKEKAINAYLLYTINRAELVDQPFLYVAEAKIVGIKNGVAVGVYDNRDDAILAVADDPDTEDNEAEYYNVEVTTEEGLFLCCFLPTAAQRTALIYNARTAYKEFVAWFYTENMGEELDFNLIYTGKGYFVTITPNGTIGEIKETEEEALEFLYGKNSSQYIALESEIPGLYICTKK